MKNLSANNFLDADPSSAAVSHRIDKDGNYSEMTGEMWVEIILESKISENVPENVRNLFETARSALAYGYFFYPLFTLGAEQLYRVAEAAAHAKCESLTAPKKSLERFKNHIEFLSSANVILVQDLQVWEFFREMRNSSSHAKRQNIYPPAMFISTLRRITEEVNKLFG